MSNQSKIEMHNGAYDIAFARMLWNTRAEHFFKDHTRAYWISQRWVNKMQFFNKLFEKSWIRNILKKIHFCSLIGGSPIAYEYVWSLKNVRLACFGASWRALSYPRRFASRFWTYCDTSSITPYLREVETIQMYRLCVSRTFTQRSAFPSWKEFKKKKSEKTTLIFPINLQTRHLPARTRQRQRPPRNTTAANSKALQQRRALVVLPVAEQGLLLVARLPVAPALGRQPHVPGGGAGAGPRAPAQRVLLVGRLLADDQRHRQPQGLDHGGRLRRRARLLQCRDLVVLDGRRRRRQWQRQPRELRRRRRQRRSREYRWTGLARVQHDAYRGGLVLLSVSCTSDYNQLIISGCTRGFFFCGDLCRAKGWLSGADPARGVMRGFQDWKKKKKSLSLLYV